jgi:hypothetical protein
MSFKDFVITTISFNDRIVLPVATKEIALLSLMVFVMSNEYKSVVLLLPDQISAATLSLKIIFPSPACAPAANTYRIASEA